MKVILQNLSDTYAQKSWVSFGLPTAQTTKFGKVKISDSRSFPAVVEGNEMFVNADLFVNERVSGVFIEDGNQIPFTLDRSILDNPEQILFSFQVRSADGLQTYRSLPMVFSLTGTEQAFFKLEKDNLVRKRFYLRTKIVEIPIVIEGWIDLYTDQQLAPFIIRASYGTTAPTGISTSLGSFSMTIGERPVIDYYKRKGLHEPVLNTGTNKWEVELVTPRAWSRASVIELTGSLITKVGNWTTEHRPTNLLARMQGPICGMYENWDGHYLSFRKTPTPPPNASTTSNSRYNAMKTALNTMGDEYSSRPYAQPKNSGQTGDQPDFGASRCEEVVSMKNPWAIYDLRWSAQAWMLRPYTNREPTGGRVLGINHPKTKTYNLRPDERFSREDMIGWPNPVPYSWPGSGYSTSDSQHRSDNLLLGLYALTRDPSLELLIKDMIELEKMGVKGGPVGPVSSPRGWGRPLISLCHMHSLGFTEVEPMIRERVDFLFRNASYKKLPADPSLTIKVLADNESKYGWNTPDNKAIRAWLPWQEAIAVMGLWAAWKQLGIVEAKELAMTVSETIARHGFFKHIDNKWYCCYAVRWRLDAPGTPLPSTSYTLTTPNYDVFVYGIHRWVLPAIRILDSEQLADANLAARVDEILTAYGGPKNWDDSCWWAV